MPFKWWLLAMCLLMAGCAPTPPLNNQQIVHEVKFCRDLGLRAARFENFNGETVRIECRPPGE